MKTESRQVLYIGSEWSPSYERTDLSLVLSKRVGLGSILAGGYLIRFEGGAPVHRFIQQFTSVNTGRHRLTHRVVFDQTTSSSESTSYRLRYRMSLLFPLSGQSIDAREFYIKTHGEFLNLYQTNYDIELRAIAFIGYKFNDGNKIELGLDNRFTSFVDGAIQSRSWLTLAWYLVV